MDICHGPGGQVVSEYWEPWIKQFAADISLRPVRSLRERQKHLREAEPELAKPTAYFVEETSWTRLPEG